MTSAAASSPEWAEPEPQYDPRHAALLERQRQIDAFMAALEQQPPYDEPEPDPAAIAAEEDLAHQAARDNAWSARAQRDLENIEADLGRPLSDRETHAVLADHKRDFDAGVEPAEWKSAAAADIADTGTRAGRVQRALDSIADTERRESGTTYDPDEREWAEPASSHPRDVRTAKAQNFVNFGVTSEQQRETGESQEED